MEITFDPNKDQANITKHGVSLVDAAKIEWEKLWARPDDRKDYGEARMIGMAYIGERLYTLVYVDRNGSLRVISLRKSNSRVVHQYAKA